MDRKLGIMYNLDIPGFFMGVSAFTGTGLSGANTATKGFTSVGALGRFVWRPIARSSAIAQSRGQSMVSERVQGKENR